MPNPWAGNGRTQRSICTALLPVDTFSAWENRNFFFFFLSFPFLFLFLLPYLLSNFHFPFLPLCPQRMFNSRGSFWASPAGPALAEGWRALCCPASLPWTRLWHLLPSTGPDGPGTAPRNGLSWLQHRHKVGRGHCCLFSCPQSHQVRAGRPRLDPPKSPKDFKSTEQINHGITAPARAGSKPCPLCPWLSGSCWAGKHSLWLWGRRDPLFSSSMAQSLPPMSTPGSGLSVCPRERQP